MTYNELLTNLLKLNKDYKVKVIGKTKFNRNIFAVERIVDKSFSTAILLAGIHARENITTDLVFEMIKRGLFDKIDKFNISFILMANPDGVQIQSGYLKEFPISAQNEILKMNNFSEDFSLWKANALGVDLNNNFDARFGTNVHSKCPSSQGFIGEHAFSENETKAIFQYTLSVKPFISISYHSKGEEIYFNFFQKGKIKARDEKIAKRFAQSTLYRIVNVEKLSSGGYKDWCVEKLKIPALTIEVGDDKLSHPITKINLNEIFDKNKTIAFDLEFAYNEFIKHRWRDGILWKIYVKSHEFSKKGLWTRWGSSWGCCC